MKIANPVTKPNRERLEALASVAPLAKDAATGPRRFSMLAYTGVDFSRAWGQMAIELDGIEALPERGLPMLRDHDPRRPVGVATSAKRTKAGLELEGYLLDTPDGQEVARLADQGFPFTASVGVARLSGRDLSEKDEEEINGRAMKGPLSLWTKSRLYETSFITAGPADDATGAEVMSMGSETETVPATPATPSAETMQIARTAILAERKAYVAQFPDKRKWAAARFDEGMKIEEAHKQYATMMREERDAALERVDHEASHGRLEERDAKRVAAGISKGFDPNDGSAKPKRITNGPRATLKIAERLWNERSEEGLLLRGVFPIHAGGHRLLHAMLQAEENGIIRARFGKTVPFAPKYSLHGEAKDGKLESPLVDQLARAFKESTDTYAPGKMESLAGTWGKDAHSYSVMTVKGFLAALFKPLEDDVGRGWAQRIGMTIPSNQEIETYRFLGNPPQIRKWQGMRQTKFFPPFELKIGNDTYEGTVDFGVNDFRFDKSGHIALRMGELGIRARQHWDVLGTQVLLTNPTGYDGQALFSAAHTQGGGFTMKNLLTKADVPGLGVVNPANPTQGEAVAALMGVIQYMFTYQDQTGSPINGNARQFVAIVPPNLWGPFVTAVRAARLNFGQDNPLLEQDYSVEVIPNGWLVTGFVGDTGNTNSFYVGRVDSQYRGLVFQDVTGWEAQMLGPGSDTTVMRDRIIYGLRAVRGAGPGEWAHLVKATLG